MSDQPAVPMTPMYRAVMSVSSPIMRRWSRLQVRGLDNLPPSGPVLVVGNHDSYWDPIAIGVAARYRRQIRALAKSSIWKPKPIGWLMDGMGNIPVERGRGDLAAMEAVVRELEAGSCIGIFPEGTRSLGRELPAHSGTGRLALAVPETVIVCVRVIGTVDVVRVPRRPSVKVEFFLPSGGQPQPGEHALRLTRRLMAEIREGAPRTVPGRRRTEAKYRAQLEARSADPGEPS